MRQVSVIESLRKKGPTTFERASSARRSKPSAGSGRIFLRPDDGELLRMEGDLAKPPSFWTRHVRVARQFQRFAGVRMPVSLDAVANIRFFGVSSFRAVYDYETVNAERVGTPQLRAARR